MNFSNITFEVMDKVAKITLNRPDVRNAINIELLTEMIQAVGHLSKTDEVKALILTGVQDIFSGGLLGLNSFSKTLFSYLCGKASKRLNIKNMIVQIALIAFFSLLEGILFLFILRIFHLRKEMHETLMHLVFPQTLYTMVLTPIIFRLINFLLQKWALLR